MTQCDVPTTFDEVGRECVRIHATLASQLSISSKPSQIIIFADLPTTATINNGEDKTDDKGLRYKDWNDGGSHRVCFMSRSLRVWSNRFHEAAIKIQTYLKGSFITVVKRNYMYIEIRSPSGNQLQSLPVAKPAFKRQGQKNISTTTFSGNHNQSVATTAAPSNTTPNKSDVFANLETPQAESWSGGSNDNDSIMAQKTHLPSSLLDAGGARMTLLEACKTRYYELGQVQWALDAQPMTILKILPYDYSSLNPYARLYLSLHMRMTGGIDFQVYICGADVYVGLLGVSCMPYNIAQGSLTNEMLRTYACQFVEPRQIATQKFSLEFCSDRRYFWGASQTSTGAFNGAPKTYPDNSGTMDGSANMQWCLVFWVQTALQNPLNNPAPTCTLTFLSKLSSDFTVALINDPAVKKALAAIEGTTLRTCSGVPENRVLSLLQNRTMADLIFQIAMDDVELDNTLFSLVLDGAYYPAPQLNYKAGGERIGTGLSPYEKQQVDEIVQESAHMLRPKYSWLQVRGKFAANSKFVTTLWKSNDDVIQIPSSSRPESYDIPLNTAFSNKDSWFTSSETITEFAYVDNIRTSAPRWSSFMQYTTDTFLTFASNPGYVVAFFAIGKRIPGQAWIPNALTQQDPTGAKDDFVMFQEAASVFGTDDSSLYCVAGDCEVNTEAGISFEVGRIPMEQSGSRRIVNLDTDWYTPANTHLLAKGTFQIQRQQSTMLRVIHQAGTCDIVCIKYKIVEVDGFYMTETSDNGDHTFTWGPVTKQDADHVKYLLQNSDTSKYISGWRLMQIYCKLNSYTRVSVAIPLQSQLSKFMTLPAQTYQIAFTYGNVPAVQNNQYRLPSGVFPRFNQQIMEYLDTEVCDGESVDFDCVDQATQQTIMTIRYNPATQCFMIRSTNAHSPYMYYGVSLDRLFIRNARIVPTSSAQTFTDLTSWVDRSVTTSDQIPDIHKTILATRIPRKLRTLGLHSGNQEQGAAASMIGGSALQGVGGGLTSWFQQQWMENMQDKRYTQQQALQKMMQDFQMQLSAGLWQHQTQMQKDRLKTEFDNQMAMLSEKLRLSGAASSVSTLGNRPANGSTWRNTPGLSLDNQPEANPATVQQPDGTFSTRDANLPQVLRAQLHEATSERSTPGGDLHPEPEVSDVHGLLARSQAEMTPVRTPTNILSHAMKVENGIASSRLPAQQEPAESVQQDYPPHDYHPYNVFSGNSDNWALPQRERRPFRFNNSPDFNGMANNDFHSFLDMFDPKTRTVSVH